MKENKNSGALPRRSFMKKSVIAAVAASSPLIYSGLVNAEESHPSDLGPGGNILCDMEHAEVKNQQGEVIAVECWAAPNGGPVLLRES